MHEENFLSSWLREDGKAKEGRIMEIGEETKEQEEEENETGER